MMNLSFVKIQSNINRSEKERKVKAIFLSWDKEVLSRLAELAKLVFLSQPPFWAFGTMSMFSAVKIGLGTRILDKLSQKIFCPIYRNVRASGTMGQLLYIPTYIYKKISIYKKYRELGLGEKQQYTGVRNRCFFCPFVPSPLRSSMFLSPLPTYGIYMSIIAPLGKLKRFFNILFQSTRNEIRNLIFIIFSLPVFSELNPEFCIEVIS